MTDEPIRADVSWNRRGAAFADLRYSRAHAWRFDGGAEVPASASPGLVSGPWTDPAAVDPEEAFVAALSSCHMLTFLYLAAQDGLVVDDYRDAAEGRIGTTASGRKGVARVVLNPRIVFAGPAPTDAALFQLHRRAHEACFIAASVTSEVEIRAVATARG
jgi:organic hydroperoxide reductase OsmC/OhrA